MRLAWKSAHIVVGATTTISHMSKNGHMRYLQASRGCSGSALLIVSEGHQKN